MFKRENMEETPGVERENIVKTQEKIIIKEVTHDIPTYIMSKQTNKQMYLVYPA